MFEEIENLLHNAKFLRANRRRHMNVENANPYSAIMGYRTWRNKYDLSRMTKQYPELYEKLKQIMHEHDPDFEYTTMTLNKNFQCARHIDGNNVGESYIIGFGNYNGGELNIENTKIDIKHKFHKFNGCKQYHWVEPWTDGDRYSVVYYKNLHKH